MHALWNVLADVAASSWRCCCCCCNHARGSWRSRAHHMKPRVHSPPKTQTCEEFRRCTDGGKNTVFQKDTLRCVFCTFTSHRRDVARRRIQSGRWGEHPHPRIWMRLWRIINTTCDAPASLGREEAQGCSSASVFFLSITKKTIIHLLFFCFSPISVHFRPVACIVRLPKWFARLKSLQTNTRP